MRLHPEHGVNPTCGVCLFCGKDNGVIALLGAAYKGKAPRHMILDTNPCDICRGQMARGITLVEAHARHKPDTVPAGKDGPYLTGRWLVLTEEAVQRWEIDADLKGNILRRRKAYIEPDVFKTIIMEQNNGTDTTQTG